MIKIGELAKICGTTTQTLRYYDSEGVLKADFVDKFTGYRLYSADAVEKYKQIIFYKELGFSLDEIKMMLSLTFEESKRFFVAKKEELNQNLKQLEQKISVLNKLCISPASCISASQPVIDQPFENDSKVIGRWKLLGALTNEAALTYEAYPTAQSENFSEIVLLPGGALAWNIFWSKGTVYRLSHKYRFAIPNSYRVIQRDEKNYMILQYISNSCIEQAQDPITLLFEQLDNIPYTENQIKKRIDSTDMAYEDDAQVLGCWEVCDFVAQPELFEPQIQSVAKENLVTVMIRFFVRGLCIKTFKTKHERTLRYTKGYVLNQSEQTAEEYFIREIDGNEYLFVQHKSGDYTFGGKEPYWYVFKKVIL